MTRLSFWISCRRRWWSCWKDTQSWWWRCFKALAKIGRWMKFVLSFHSSLNVCIWHTCCILGLYGIHVAYLVYMAYMLRTWSTCCRHGVSFGRKRSTFLGVFPIDKKENLSMQYPWRVQRDLLHTVIIEAIWCASVKCLARAVWESTPCFLVSAVCCEMVYIPKGVRWCIKGGGTAKGYGNTDCTCTFSSLF